MQVDRTEEFQRWFDDLSEEERAQIATQIHDIERHRHFGDAKGLGGGLAEFRRRNGRRVYFAKPGRNRILLLIGGLKNAQKKDIKKARLLLSRHGDRAD
jgi:putative addiction module killer protein